MAEEGRILIADDEEVFLHSTADLLRRQGHECDTAQDGPAAIKMLGAKEYDLLIADIRMPGNPELELILDLPKIAAELPVILVTGYPSLRSAIQSVQLPVAAYLVKPFEFDELLAQVQVSIEHIHTYRTIRSARQRMLDLCHDLQSIEQAMSIVPREGSTITVDAFLRLTIGNIAGGLADLKYLTEACVLQDSEQPVCRLFRCPREAMFMESLLETIDVLKDTKKSFKSKELGELRARLEGTVRAEWSCEVREATV